MCVEIERDIEVPGNLFIDCNLDPSVILSCIDAKA